MAETSTGEQPSEKHVGFNYALFLVCSWSRKISIATWFRLDERERKIPCYVLCWLITLSLILAVGPTDGWLRWVMVGLAFYRLQDLIFSTLDNALKLTCRSQLPTHYTGPAPSPTRRRAASVSSS